jgi:ABC-type taurine transport system ATPase subunit
MEVVSFTLRSLYPRGKAPGTHWIGGYVSPSAGSDAVAKRRISAPVGDRTSVVQPVAYLLDWLSYPASLYSEAIKTES